MSDNSLSAVDQLAGKVLEALADILRGSTSPEALQAQNLLLKRMALEGDVFPSRVPPPRNISEVGGYLNLLGTLNETEMRTTVLASILGVAGPGSMTGLAPTGPILYDVLRANDRPAGPAQASVPVQFRVRNDFAPALDAALEAIHDAGCALPVLSSPPSLPLAGPGVAPPSELLSYLGRTLELVPGTALVDPDTDALAVARLDGTTALLVAARQLDGAAPQATSVATQKWVAWKCDATACTESTADRKYLPLAPILNAAGWYQSAVTAPATLAAPGNWARWTNVTGLVAGVSKFGDELGLRFARGEIAASSLRDALAWVWDGTTFRP
jgi:hypothetical protein